MSVIFASFLNKHSQYLEGSQTKRLVKRAVWQRSYMLYYMMIHQTQTTASSTSARQCLHSEPARAHAQIPLIVPCTPQFPSWELGLVLAAFLGSFSWTSITGHALARCTWIEYMTQHALIAAPEQAQMCVLA